MNPDPSRQIPPAPAEHPSPPSSPPVDASTLSTVYANFCRVVGTPEELVLDFGLNTQVTPQPTEPIKLTHRLVVNYYTAKRLLQALAMAIQQHENIYGVLEIDVQKRMRGGAFRPTPQSPRSDLGGGQRLT